MVENGKSEEKIIDLIAKLLVLAADDGATEAEKKNAMEKAETIMLKYNIDQARRVLTKEKVESNGASDTKVQFFAGCRWEQELGWGIARAFECRGVGFTGYMTFIGIKEDLELVVYFFNRLLRYINSAGRKAYPRSKANQRAYCLGMSIRVVERLKELYANVAKRMPNECMALIVVKKDAIAKRMDELFPRGLGKARRISTSQYNPALNAGYRDGAKVSLHSNRVQVRN